jgi:hypothetical protein
VFGSANTGSTGAAFNRLLSTPNPVKPLFAVLPSSELNATRAMVNVKPPRFHREFKFGRSNGHWTINNEGWMTSKIAASDVGQNTWEVWKFSTGGGWFHPIHVSPVA